MAALEAPKADEWEEELEDVPEEEKAKDPLRNASIKRTGDDGAPLEGKVVDIEQGQLTKERLYRIVYTDGDLQHMTAEEVRGCMVRDRASPSPERTGNDEPMEAEDGEGEEEEDDAGDDEVAEEAEEKVMKKPAAAPKGKAAAKGKAAGKAEAKPKAKAKGRPKAQAVMKKPGKK
mmetsp:Transcript_24558/g.70055  ORF Transcript_24558/g.70055 Transcript_24558/m.70055 type:complete len:175 (+) Transcript_24558:64-588(+)